MKLSIPAGTTSKRIGIFVQDSSSTTGAGLSGLVFNTSGLKCYSWIDTDGNAGGTAQTLATATLGTWTTIGFVEKDATNMKGMYEFGIPNALIASGVKWAILYFFGATNMAPLVVEIEVTATSNQDGTAGGISRIDAAISSRMATFTLPTNFSSLVIDVNGRVDLSKWIGVAPNALISGRVDANAQVVGDKTGYSLSQSFPTNFSSLAITAGGAVTVGTNNDKTGYAIGSGGIDAAALTSAALNAMADQLLDRNMSTGTDSGTDSTSVRTPRQALRVLRNKASIAAGTLTVTKEDDSTTSWTAAVATTAGNPISSVDPT